MTGGDMVQNLVMAAVANENLETQEQFYFQYWLKLRLKIEVNSGSLVDMTNINQDLIIKVMKDILTEIAKDMY